MLENFLEHYGVKGMKWGKRKSRNEAARAAKFKPSADAKKAVKIIEKSKSGLNTLSNDEMQTAINRMNLEVNFSRLNDQTRKKSRGEQVLRFLMNDVAEVQVKRVVTNQAAISVEQALRSKGQTELANRMKPKKK